MNNDKPLTAEQVRQIVREEMQMNYQAGSPNIPPHTHNGTDNLNINPIDLEGFTPLPSSPAKYQKPDGSYEYGFSSQNTLIPGDASHAPQTLANTAIAQYPIPIVIGNGAGLQSAFEGGYAPEGCLVAFMGTVAPILYIKFDGSWYGAQLTEVV